MVAANIQPRRLMFRLGQTVATPGALRALAVSGECAGAFLVRHATGDWGDLCDDDKRSNDEAIAHEGDLEQQSRVVSAYHTKSGEKIWVITEADRSGTCVLLPNEF
jgi:hypothetical protein